MYREKERSKHTKVFKVVISACWNMVCFFLFLFLSIVEFSTMHIYCFYNNARRILGFVSP